MLNFLANLIAFIFPSEPSFPNPPGTKIPLNFERIFEHSLKLINFLESIQDILTYVLLKIPL